MDINGLSAVINKYNHFSGRRRNTPGCRMLPIPGSIRREKKERSGNEEDIDGMPNSWRKAREDRQAGARFNTAGSGMQDAL